MAKHYLWSPINTEVNEFGRVMKTAKVGEEVTADKLNMSKDDFAELIAVGTVRNQPYPDIPADVAPTEHFRALEGEGADLTSAERKELQTFREEAAKREAEAQEKATTGDVTPKAGEGQPGKEKSTTTKP